jgi:hypothetical protein
MALDSSNSINVTKISKSTRGRRNSAKRPRGSNNIAEINSNNTNIIITVDSNTKSLMEEFVKIKREELALLNRSPVDKVFQRYEFAIKFLKNMGMEQHPMYKSLQSDYLDFALLHLPIMQIQSPFTNFDFNTNLLATSVLTFIYIKSVVIQCC